MSRVMLSGRTGAAVYVFSGDHCPPHVHARHRGNGWIARVRFSFIANSVDLMSVAPLRNAPFQRTTAGLLADVAAGLTACRRSWWLTKQTTCLANQWVVMSLAGRMDPSATGVAGAQQIADATYDPDEERLLVVFRGGQTVSVSTKL